MSSIRRIGVFLDLIGAYGRGIAMGVQAYGEEVGNWHCQYPRTWPFGEEVDIERWNVDGWIGYSRETKIGALLLRKPAPLITISAEEAVHGRPTVSVDNGAVGRMAFDYLLDSGHRNFAFAGHFKAAFSVQRLAGYSYAVEQHGAVCHTYTDFNYTPEARAALRDWLKNLPKPVGILTPSDDIGCEVLDLCRDNGIAVPEVAAVLSVDNDELLCNVRFPTLSSIELDTYRIGYEAAAALDRMLDGGPPPTVALLIPPIRVVARQSTDALAFADEDVRRAVTFIRGRRAAPTTVADVIEQATISSRTLEKRFREQLKSSILGYIHRVHVDHAVMLLKTTDLSIEQVAKSSGFGSMTRMGIVFNKILRKTPRACRKSDASTRQSRRAIAK